MFDNLDIIKYDVPTLFVMHVKYRNLLERLHNLVKTIWRRYGLLLFFRRRRPVSKNEKHIFVQN